MIDRENRDYNGFVNHPINNELLKITGEISNYRVSRDSASFVFTEGDRNMMGVIAVSASLAGLGGQATAISSNANSLEEAADYVEFNIGEKEMRGWLWRSPFLDGDMVNVAAENRGEYFELFGVSRPSDKMIALYPHCSRSKNQHIKNAFKWWLIISVCMLASIVVLDYFMHDGLTQSLEYWNLFFRDYMGGLWVAAVFLFLSIPVISMSMKWMPFVRVADKVFRTLELPNISDIDLVKSSKKQRTPKDKAEFGSMYFKY
jgi:hypothetical protein